jgi:LysM repeat protein
MRILVIASLAGLALISTACTRSMSTPPPTSTGQPGSFQQATMEAVLSTFLTQTAQAMQPADGTPQPTATTGVILVPTITPHGTQPEVYVTTTSNTPAPTGITEHVVQPGQWLLAISREYGFDTYPQPIIDLNGLTPPYGLYPGQVLKIPDYGPTAGLEGTPMPGSTTYVVQEGDWVLSIARKFGLDPLVITAANGLSFPYLVQVGQTLTIP